MSYLQNFDVTRMTWFLEAEMEGRPFDRQQARELAKRLAEINPHISKSMALIANRCGEEASVI